MFNVRVISSGCKPVQSHPTDAGYDVFSTIDKTIEPGEKCKIPLGFATSFEPGYVAMLCNRSGLSTKHDLILANCNGIIDPDYRGEWIAVLRNVGTVPYTIHKGDRVAQVLFMPVVLPKLNTVGWLESSERDDGGFGSSGL